MSCPDEEKTPCQKAAEGISKLRVQTVHAEVLGPKPVSMASRDAVERLLAPQASPLIDARNSIIVVPDDGFASFYDCVNAQVPPEVGPEMQDALNEIRNKLAALEECCNNPGTVVVPGGSTFSVSYSGQTDAAVKVQGTFNCPISGNITKISYVLDGAPVPAAASARRLIIRMWLYSGRIHDEVVFTPSASTGDNAPKHFEGFVNFEGEAIPEFGICNFATIIDVPGIDQEEWGGNTSLTIFVSGASTRMVLEK